MKTEKSQKTVDPRVCRYRLQEAAKVFRLLSARVEGRVSLLLLFFFLFHFGGAVGGSLQFYSESKITTIIEEKIEPLHL